VQASQRSARMSCETYLNGAEVDEEVGRSVLGGDETVSLLVVEPLDGAVLAVRCSGVHFDMSVLVYWWWMMSERW
jgi:hypothetical protein